MVNESINNKRNWGKTFGQLTWEQFRKNRLNIVCLGFIILLFVIAVFAPFIANSKPYFAVIDGELSFPLFAALDSSDYSVLFAAACCIGLIFKVKSNTKKYTPSVRGEIFLRQLMITAGIILAGVIFFKAVIPTYNSTVNYKLLVQESEKNWAVFPPVP